VKTKQLLQTENTLC